MRVPLASIATALAFFTVTALFVISLTSCSQRLMGKWYSVNRSGLIEIEITDDAIITQALYSDFTEKDINRKDVKPYKRIIELADRTLIVLPDEKDPKKLSAWTLFNVLENKMFEIAWNGLDTAVTDINTLISLHEGDKRQLLGYYSFRRSYMDSLKKLKSIEQMSLGDFRHFAEAFVNKVLSQEEEVEKKDFGIGSITYNYQIMSQSLFQVGVNPIQTVDEIGSAFKKYHSDSTVKQILTAIKNNKARF